MRRYLAKKSKIKRLSGWKKKGDIGNASCWNFYECYLIDCAVKLYWKIWRWSHNKFLLYALCISTCFFLNFGSHFDAYPKREHRRMLPNKPAEITYIDINDTASLTLFCFVSDHQLWHILLIYTNTDMYSVNVRYF